MATVRISESELARHLHAVLAKVQSGVEVIVEQDHRAVAVDLNRISHNQVSARVPRRHR